MKHKQFYIVFFLSFIFGLSAFGQNRKQLEKQRKRLQLEIKEVNRLLFKTQKKEKSALEFLQDINQKIDVREKLIQTINLETKYLLNKIAKNKKEIQKLNKKLADLKTDYADMIFKSYKSKSQQSKTMFLLSSKNFYQAYKRLQYMKQYASFRKKQGEEIALQTKEIQKLTDSLQYQKKVKDTLIAVKKQQKKKIEIDRKNQQGYVSSIKRKENKYKRDLRKKQQQEKRISDRIDRLIRNAIAKSNRKKGVKKSKVFALTPEAKALASRFEKNKGKLPWPVKKGIIVRKFGKQPHPTLRGITVNGTGLHIVTDKNAKAKAIFGGKVMAIFRQSEGKKSVLVRHGNYITAYNNLENVTVKTDQTIKIGQELGTIFTNKITGKTKLIFVLYKNTKKINPYSWIIKR